MNQPRHLRRPPRPRRRRRWREMLPDLPPDAFARVQMEPPRDPAHGDMATNAAMVVAKAARQPPPKLAAAAGRAPVRAARGRRSRARRPRLRQPPARAKTFSAPSSRSILAAGRVLRRQHDRRRPPRQRGVRLRQPDRPDACRPLPRRRGGRRAGQPAGQGRLRRHEGILHQRRRRAGAGARPGRLLALPPGPRHDDDRGGVRRHRSPAACNTAATTWSRSARHSANAYGDSLAAAGRPCPPTPSSGSTRCATSPWTAMMDSIRDDLAALGVRHDVFVSERALDRGRQAGASGIARCPPAA